MKEAYFRSQMWDLAKKNRSYVLNLLHPSFISGPDLKRGQEEGDMYEAMRKDNSYSEKDGQCCR